MTTYKVTIIGVSMNSYSMLTVLRIWNTIEVNMEDKDYLKATSADYKAGYEHGRTSMAIELSVALIIAGIIIYIFN